MDEPWWAAGLTDILADLLDEERLADPAQRDFAQGLIDRMLQNAERRSLRRVVEQALNDSKAGASRFDSHAEADS